MNRAHTVLYDATHTHVYVYMYIVNMRVFQIMKLRQIIDFFFN